MWGKKRGSTSALPPLDLHAQMSFWHILKENRIGWDWQKTEGKKKVSFLPPAITIRSLLFPSRELSFDHFSNEQGIHYEDLWCRCHHVNGEKCNKADDGIILSGALVSSSSIRPFSRKIKKIRVKLPRHFKNNNGKGTHARILRKKGRRLACTRV